MSIFCILFTRYFIHYQQEAAMLKFELHFMYHSELDEDLLQEQTVAVEANTINEAIDEMYYHLDDFVNSIIDDFFGDEKIQWYEYRENPRRVRDNINVVLSFKGKHKCFKNAYTFESYLCKYFKDEMEAL